MDIAIVTGASSGLGREYVKLLDDEGLDEIWLVARRRPQLEDLAGALKTKSRLYPLDLTENGSFRILQQALTDSRAIVRYLIHAAGFGKMGSVMTIPSGVQEKMVDLNDRAAISLVQLVLPYCKAGSHLVQICSCAASCLFRNWPSIRQPRSFSCATAGPWPLNWPHRESSFLPSARIGSKTRNLLRRPSRPIGTSSSAIIPWQGRKRPLPADLSGP